MLEGVRTEGTKFVRTRPRERTGVVGRSSFPAVWGGGKDATAAFSNSWKTKELDAREGKHEAASGQGRKRRGKKK